MNRIWIGFFLVDSADSAINGGALFGGARLLEGVQIQLQVSSDSGWEV